MRRLLPLAAVLAAIAALAGAVSAQGAPAPAPPAPAFSETFGSTTWWSRWGMGSRPWRTALVSESGNSFLRVGIPKGAHDGTSFFKFTGDHDAVTMRYRIRLSAGFDPSKSAHNVKLPGFGAPALGPGGLCLAGCGGAAADGIRGYSARVDVQDTGVPGFYVYDVNPVPLGYGRGMRWQAPVLTPGRWYTVEVAIAMNTVGRSDGVLKARIDGRTVFDRRDLHLRVSPRLHVGAAWFDFYYGGVGVAPVDTMIDIDDVALWSGLNL